MASLAPMHIAFLTMPVHGHVNPTLGVVAELTRRGHRVSYPAPAAFTAAVAGAGAEPAGYDAAPLSVDGLRALDGHPFANFQLAMLEDSVSALSALEGRLAGAVPDVVAFDLFSPFAGRVLGRQHGIPMVATSPCLMSNEHYSAFAPFLPPGAAAPGADDPAVVRLHRRFAEFAGSRGVPAAEHDGLVRLDASDNDELRIVFIPPRFQPAVETFDRRHRFVGPCLTDRAHQGDWTPPPDRPVLLVSLGTAFNDRPEFFRTCVEAFADTGWHVVLSVGDQVDLGRLPSNIEAHPQVPQLRVLRHARAFVSHAGGSSMMEALRNGVPLLCAPQVIEQRANAARLEELSLGRLLPPDATAPTLRKMVDDLAADPTVADHLDTMRRHLDEAGGAVAAANAIEAHAIEAHATA